MFGCIFEQHIRNQKNYLILKYSLGTLNTTNNDEPQHSQPCSSSKKRPISHPMAEHVDDLPDLLKSNFEDGRFHQTTKCNEWHHEDPWSFWVPKFDSQAAHRHKLREKQAISFPDKDQKGICPWFQATCRSPCHPRPQAMPLCCLLVLYASQRRINKQTCW